MTIPELNRRYGAPERIVFHEGLGGYPEVILSNKYGIAEVALLGANTLSYRPTGHSPVLFRPSKRDYNRGEAIHGGIPVCWPQFGNRALRDMPQHGFVRIMPFSVKSSTYSEDMTEIVLALSSTPATRELWNHDFSIEVKITVSMKLTLQLIVKNTGDEPWDFSAGFHPYFLVRDRNNLVLRGVEGCNAVNAAENTEFTQCGDLEKLSGVDIVYSLPPRIKHEFALLDDGLRRAVALVSSGSQSLVVWNPENVESMGDLKGENPGCFVCVEPVSCWPGAATLKPGEKYDLLVAIQALAPSQNEEDRQ